MAKNVNYEKNIVNCCPGMKYGNLKKWTTKKILRSNKKSQYRLSSISIYIFYTRNILPMLIWCYQQFVRGKIILHARILNSVRERPYQKISRRRRSCAMEDNAKGIYNHSTIARTIIKARSTV